VVRLPEAKPGFVLLPRRWVVERSFAWATRFRRQGARHTGIVRKDGATGNFVFHLGVSSQLVHGWPQQFAETRFETPT